MRRVVPCALFLFGFAISGCHCGGELSHLTSEGKIAPTSIDFGTVTLGSNVQQTVTITNIGNAGLSLLSGGFAGANVGDFSLLKAFESLDLPAGQSITYTIIFTPQDASARQATFTVVTDSTSAPNLTVALNGTGIDIKICPQPANIDFGKVQINGSAVSQQLTFNNCGRSTTTVTLNPIEGPNQGDFVIAGQMTSSLAPGASLTVTVSYAPSVVGASTADIPWTACPTCTASTPIGLTGVGVDGVLTFSPSPATFGTVNQGSSATTTVTATNSGTAPITVNTLAVRGSPSPFSIQGGPTLPLALAAGQSTTFTVKFTPSTGGAQTDNLDATYAVADPAVPGKSATDVLSGNSQQLPCTLKATPNPVFFGNVPPNVTVNRKVTLTNVGQLICHVSAIALGAGTDPYFSLSSAGVTSLTVAVGGTATIGLNFSPTSASAPLARSGTLLFNSDDPNNASFSIPLKANINPTVYTGGWPKWHLDNFNSGQTPADTSQLTGTVAWKFNVGGPCCTGGSDFSFMHSPVIDGTGNIYFENAGTAQVATATNATLYSVSPSGTQNWAVPVSDPSGDLHPATPVLLADGTLYATSGQEQGVNPNLYLMTASSGAITWSTKYSPPNNEGFSATPALGNDGTLFETDDDGMPDNPAPTPDPYDAVTYKKDATGTPQLGPQFKIPFTTTYTSAERASIVIASDNTSYWCSGNQCFGMTAPGSGFTLLPTWPASGVLFYSSFDPSTLSGSVTSDVAMDSSPGGYLYAYAGWQTFVSGASAVAGALTALNPSNGSIVWTLALPATALPTGAQFTSADFGNASPAVGFDGTVYVGNGDGLRAVDGKTGVVNWLFKSADVTSAPAIGADGTIYFGVKDGTFYAVNTDGTLRFQVKAGAQISAAPAIASDGTVVFVSDDGFLYKIK